MSATTSSNSLISVQGLSKSYGGVHAIQDMSFDLRKGEICGVIGPNGAGKSTFIGLLGGALKPTAGTIHFDGNDVTRLDAAGRARLGIGRTYQVPRPFLDMSVRDNLLTAMFALNPWCGNGEANDTCDAILERTGLLGQRNLKARNLPLLRRKRLEIARALAIQPRLLLLDEVGAGLLDSEVGELIDLIQSLRSELDSVIIIEHVLRVVRECCDRSLVINFGKKVTEGRTDDVLDSEEVAQIYLGAHGGATSQSKDAPLSGKALNLDRLIAPRTTTSPPKTLLYLQDIHAGYGQAKVLQGITIEIVEGESVAILGTNGAGKTTLSNVISGVLKPTSGALRFDDKEITVVSSHLRARSGIAYCPEGRKIFANLTVEENLLINARTKDVAELSERLEQVYSLFPDLKQRRRDPGTAMSGGQQQMLAIGRALMSRPKLVIFDEISLGLAPVMMDKLYQALSILKAEGMTMVIVEQDVQRALEIADKVHVLERGQIALSGSAHQIMNDPRLRAMYVGEAKC
ncbi:ATP-binding cassette domain-containing protein [Pseudomonas japonica]|uniref:ABC-type branched-chain amino acid transport system, ATPase component n=1 Tax=Pseudomonas japonica TaxID=256466 RepID=A0A239JGT7_9PSED|nr:ATP-binding cassette domain-containing protein [Pseudomonas japonica]SNT05246.1 ABC-type branched-chain amino acid transport system, ATPase component [Pseudomonas japonica]